MNKKTLVAYFSITNTTKKVATLLADICNANLHQIEAFQPYTEEDLDWRDDNSRCNLEMGDEKSRPLIKQSSLNINQYEIIFLGFPIWWERVPRIINTFLESYNLTNKIIIPFATSGGSTLEKVRECLVNSCKNAKLFDAKLWNYYNFASLQAWVKNLYENFNGIE